MPYLINLLVDQLCNKPVPSPVDRASPFAVCHANHPEIEAQVGGELDEQVDAEARAAAEIRTVVSGCFIGQVHYDCKKRTRVCFQVLPCFLCLVLHSKFNRT